MSNLTNVMDLNETIKQRINTTVDFPLKDEGAFVLYLPTVNLRFKHNPAFSLACQIANKLLIPVIVLAVVLDDTHLQEKGPKPIVFTARRVAFVLEAVQHAAQGWQAHGAGVAVRVHGPSHRTPHHLTLLRKAAAVVSDEPFVHPYLGFLQSVERVARGTNVPVFRVDGSTTIAPVSKLAKIIDSNGNVTFKGVPNKAWRWQKQTDPQRRTHINAIVKDRQFDAPPLMKQLPSDFFLDSHTGTALGLPSEWMAIDSPCPGKRPWSADELSSISDIKSWVLTWPGIDASVPPCSQTHGSSAAGHQRWARFCQNQLASYARSRNNIIKPHSVSRMSCYLNIGAVSIFQCIFELWQSNAGQGGSKFADEIIKWREIGYVHAFGNPDSYNQAAVVPGWAQSYLERCNRDGLSSGNSYSLEALETGTSDNETWNAMQQYLVSTGELHNNARMTWGKTVVHWQKHDHSVNELLQQLVYLNDRFALDGLSPPSYAGLLWCFGWCDKPQNAFGAISEKSASRYRQQSSAFVEAKRSLLSEQVPMPSIGGLFCQPKKRNVSDEDTAAMNSTTALTEESPMKKGKGSILSYFPSTRCE